MTKQKFDELYLTRMAQKIRLETIRLAFVSEYAHPGPSLSITDILVSLYYNELNIDPKNPEWSERDRFVLSKGHGCLSLYAILADLGFYLGDENLKLRKIGSFVQGHPDMRKTPGIDMTTGSLGNGFAAAVGMAISLKNDSLKSRVFTILGDGELQEGIVWEAVSTSAYMKLNNLIAIVDRNGFQSDGLTRDINDNGLLKEKWKAFGWNVVEIDGHNIKEILKAFNLVSNMKDKPLVIIAHTVKGKGVSFMENNNSWHQHGLTKEQKDQAIRELSNVGGDIDING